MLNRRRLLLGIVGLLGLGRLLANAEAVPLIKTNGLSAGREPILVNGWVLLSQDLDELK